MTSWDWMKCASVVYLCIAVSMASRYVLITEEAFAKQQQKLDF